MRIIVYLLALLSSFAFILMNYRSPKNDNHYHLIAHGGGNIEDVVMTESIEAFENSVKNGCKYIELDLYFTQDSDLIAKHHESYAQDLYRKLYSKDIDSLFLHYEDIYFVTDRISDPVILEKYFSAAYKDRMIVESFSYNDYYQLWGRGFHKPFISGAMSKTDLIKVLLREWRNDKCLVYSVEGFNEYKMILNLLSWVSPFSLALFSAKDRAEADSLALTDSRIKYVYVDRLSE